MQETVICPICGERITREYMLNPHLTSEVIICDECGYEYNYSWEAFDTYSEVIRGKYIRVRYTTRDDRKRFRRMHNTTLVGATELE